METARLSFTALLCTALLCTSATPALADAPATIPGNSHTMERAVMHQINRHVIFPLADGAAMFGTVDVAFVVDVKGRLVVKESSSANAALRDYVVRKLAKVHVGPNPSGLWKITHLRFTFRPE